MIAVLFLIIVYCLYRIFDLHRRLEKVERTEKKPTATIIAPGPNWEKPIKDFNPEMPTTLRPGKLQSTDIEVWQMEWGPAKEER